MDTALVDHRLPWEWFPVWLSEQNTGIS